MTSGWRRTAAAAVAVLAVSALSACDAKASGPASTDADPTSAETAKTAKPAPMRLVTNLDDPASVPVDTTVRIDAEGGSLEAVQVTSPAGELPGQLEAGTWQASSRLEPGTNYVLKATAERSDGSKIKRRQRFSTVELSLDEQTYASLAPLSGETVGVGMPVIVTFDLPVTDQATFERHMTVTSTPAQPGSWHWLSDREAHWRPKTYWRSGTDVSVDVDVNSLPAGNGIYGQDSRSIDFHVGDAVISKIDVNAHTMRTSVNGGPARTIPISAGKAGWDTRSGTKVVIEKFRSKRMDAGTIGVAENDPEYYDLSNVEYALRVTYSGEFIHAAPWSVGSQGSSNVSHGCVGMSTDNAQWLYDHTRRGDVVEVTGSDRQMTLDNGYGDWNLSYAAWRKGSALR